MGPPPRRCAARRAPPPAIASRARATRQPRRLARRSLADGGEALESRIARSRRAPTASRVLADGYFVDSSEKHNFAPVRLTIGAHELGTLDDALVGIRAGGVRRVLVPLAQAGTAAQISGKLELEFGPSRQLARQFNRPDPDNVFIYELQVDKVQPAV